MMKRILLLTLVCSLFLVGLVPAANADTVILANLSYQELLDLGENHAKSLTYINRELMTRPEFKKVEVPKGIYEIGVDIPAGKWTITNTGISSSLAIVTWGTKLNEYGTKITLWDEISEEWLNENESVTWNLTKGTYVEIGRTVTFSTPLPATKLGF